VCANSIAWYSFLAILFFGAGLVVVLALKLRLWLLFCTSFWWPKVLTSALLSGDLCSNQKEATSQVLGSRFWCKLAAP